MNKFFFTLTIALILFGCKTENKNELSETSTPKEVLAALVEGNKRFVEGHTVAQHRDLNYVFDLNAGQHPQVAVVACSDSRVPVELLFDQGFGDIFVIRTAGNTILDDLSMGSVDYALNHLGVKVIMFLGHTNCGAITGVVQMGHEHHHIEHDEEVVDMLKLIGDSLEEHCGTNCNVEKAINDNSVNQAKIYSSRPFIQEKINKGELLVLPAIYDLASGKVNIKE